MALLLQVLGVLAGGLAIGVLARGSGIGAPSDSRRVVGGVAIVAAVAGALLFWGNVWSIGDAFNRERANQPARSAFEAGTWPGVVGGANVGFLYWAGNQMGPDDTFALVPARARKDTFVNQWSTFQLTPHRLVSEREADWLVFYDAQPRRVAYDRGQYGPPKVFFTGFAVARRNDAG